VLALVYTQALTGRPRILCVTHYDVPNKALRYTGIIVSVTLWAMLSGSYLMCMKSRQVAGPTVITHRR
jgi:hypothetical protein